MSDLFELEPERYSVHPLHSENKDWQQTNCYVDLWVEVLHALGLEPLACLSFTLCSEFEGDQWTFFKPPHRDLRYLYGIRVEEISFWKPVLEHCVQHLSERRVPLLEADSYYLPDTNGTDYRTNHVKTTIAPTFISLNDRSMRYFHNAGFYELSGSDFDGVFRFDVSEGREEDDVSAKPRWLPPYCEMVKTDRIIRTGQEELAQRSLELAREHFRWRPLHNPLRQLAGEWAQHQESLIEGGLERYHGYAFSTLRQCGANYSMLAAHLRWLDSVLEVKTSAAATPFDEISGGCKSMLLKLARAVHSRRPGDFRSLLNEMAEQWQRGMEALTPVLQDT